MDQSKVSAFGADKVPALLGNGTGHWKTSASCYQLIMVGGQAQHIGGILG